MVPGDDSNPEHELAQSLRLGLTEAEKRREASDPAGALTVLDGLRRLPVTADASPQVRALFGEVQSRAGEMHRALDEPDAAAERFREAAAWLSSTDEAQRNLYASARYGLIAALYRGDPISADTEVERFIAEFRSAPEAGLQKFVARTLLAQGFHLGKQGCPAKEIASYDRVLELFGAHDHPDLASSVATALNNKGDTLSDLGRHDEACIVFESLIDRYAHRLSGYELEDVLSRAMLGLAFSRLKLGQASAACAAYSKLHALLKDSRSATIRRRVGRGLQYEGRLLLEMDQASEAARRFRAVVDHFGDDDDAFAVKAVITALNREGYCRELSGELAAARQCYESAYSRAAAVGDRATSVSDELHYASERLAALDSDE